MIREATLSDFAAVSALEDQIFTLHLNARPDMVEPRKVPLDYGYFEEYVNGMDTRIFVYDEDGDILGHCFVRHWAYKDNLVYYDMTILEIDDICVDADARGKSIGQALFSHAKAYAMEIGADHLELTVWKFNTKARAFFDHMGMQERICRMEMLLK